MTRAALGPRVYSEIKRDILSCVLRPSQVVYEAELAQHYGVSKTPIREALHALQQEGYVDIVPRRGYIVAPVSIHDVQQVLNLRLILEPAAAELATQQATVQQIRQLRRLAQRNDGQRSAGLFVVDRAFHLAVAEASGNLRLAQCIAKLLEEVERLYNLCESLRGSSRPGRNRHVQLADAIANGDAQLARETMVQTVQESRSRVLEALLGTNSQVMAPVLVSSALDISQRGFAREQAPTQITRRRR